MSLTEKQGHEVARALLKQFDPELEPALDEVWQDFLAGEQAESIPSKQHGSGIDQSSIVWGLIVVPLVHAILKKTVDLSVDAIKVWLDKRTDKSATEKNATLAEAAVREVQRAQADSSQVQYSPTKSADPG